MAFRQPTYHHHAPQRIYTTPEESSIPVQESPLTLAESEEWILFSPGAGSTTNRTHTSGKTCTAGRSRLSDFGSLNTIARSDGYDQESEHTIEDEDEEEEEDGNEDEDGELDSLDTHLHEFRPEGSLSGHQRNTEQDSSQPVLPRHDGLGSFRLDQPAIGDDAQQQLYSFERYNPRRVKRRRESLELGQLELEHTRSAEDERTRRIEAWRMEQSRLLIDEIQKETRRRKQSISTDRRASVVSDRVQEDLATMSNVDTSAIAEDPTEEESEGFWKRITRRVIHDLMGIDDDLLSIILGEALPKDELSTTPTPGHPLDELYGDASSDNRDQSSWEHRVLHRIARELGILVNQLSDHPGAFSTYLQVQQAPLPYAGLPIIPESAKDQVTEPRGSPINASGVQFQPTLQMTTPPVAIPTLTSPINDSELDPMDATPRPSHPLHDGTPLSVPPEPLTREEWEQDLDIKMVFRYLRSRFTSRSSPPPTYTYSTSHLAMGSTSDTAARAARVRQHHPLVTRSHGHRRPSVEKRSFKVTIPRDGSQVAGGPSTMHRRSGSSCASERTRLSAKLSGSSRHYWDIGGSTIGSGSLIASTGAMGSWGDV